MAHSIRTRRAQLSAAFAELGLGEERRLGQVSWKGSWRDRQLEVHLIPRRRTRYSGKIRRRILLGYQLGLNLECRVPTRLFFIKQSVTRRSWVRWIYRYRKQQIIDSVPDLLDGFHVVTRDESWAKHLLNQQAALMDIAFLLFERSTESYRASVFFQPGTLHYASGNLLPDDLDMSWIESQLDRLFRVVETAESLPEPEIKQSLNRVEHFTKDHPLPAILIGLVLIMGLLALPFILIMALLVGLAWWTGAV